MRLGEGILPEDPTQVSRNSRLSDAEFEETARRWKENEHSCCKNKELHQWETDQRRRWNNLCPNQQNFLLDLGFILDLDEWSKKQAAILQDEFKDLAVTERCEKWKMPFMPSTMDTMDLLLAGATICHASHVGPDELEKASDGRRHLQCRSSGALWGQIKGWSNNVHFMEGHHGTRRKQIPFCLHFMFITHPMCKRWHAWVFTETDHSSGFVRTCTPICVEAEDNRGVAVHRVDWDRDSNMQIPALKCQNV